MVKVELHLNFWQRLAIFLGKPIGLSLDDECAIVKRKGNNFNIKGYSYSSFHGSGNKGVKDD